jgi:5-(carboxyamino)imidazole ribonucleotide synthase
VLGILGGGQLGRMTALAAAKLGYRAHIYAPEAESPAGDVAWRSTQADYEDEAALTAFAASVDAVTVEFENVPESALTMLAALKPTRPNAKALGTAQDRLVEKRFLQQVGFETAPIYTVDSAADIREALRVLGAPVIVKTRRFGYDGKGQVHVETGGDANAAWMALGQQSSLAEGLVDFAREVSVIAARDAAGQVVCYPAVENDHENHILRTTTAPAPNLGVLADQAERLAGAAITKLGMVGLLAVEMFVTRDGKLIANEMAPRPHNSGHWTMDFAATSQFEQLVRAVMGLPLGDAKATQPAMMRNLLGDEAHDWSAMLADPTIRLHLYGKREARAGRKMGHWNRAL